MGRGRAHLAACAAIGCVAGGVYTGSAAGRIGCAVERAHSAFADLPGAADFAARAAVFWIRALVDTSTRALRVPAIAGHGAFPTRAGRHSVYRRWTGIAARAAVVEVRIELLTTAVASAVAGRAGEGTRGVLADGSGVGGAAAGSGALPAVAGIRGQIHARTPAIAGARGTGRGAFAARADLVLLALHAAPTAVGGILIGLHARTVALSKAEVTSRAALSCVARGRGVDGSTGDVVASAAIGRVMLGVDAACPARRETLLTLEIAGRVLAHGAAVVGTRASGLASSTVIGCAGKIEARSATIAQRAFAGRLAFAPRADEPAFASLSACPAVLRVTLEIDAAIATAVAARRARDLAFARNAAGLTVERIVAGLTASPAVFRIALEVDTDITASGAVWANEAAFAGETDGHAVGGSRASRAAPSAIVGVRGKHRTSAVALDFPRSTNAGIGVDTLAQEGDPVALVPATAVEVRVALLTVQILRQIVGTGPANHGKQCERQRAPRTPERPSPHQKRCSREKVAPPGTAATRARDSGVTRVFKTSSVAPVAAKTPPTPSSTRAVV